MSGAGILAYGSLISEPGREIGPLIVRRIPTLTPFPVEFARLSSTRGGAPTLVPYPRGHPVRAEVLVLADGIPLANARDLLWRRETRREGSNDHYTERTGPNAVWIRDSAGLCGIDHVLYADFRPDGKLSSPEPASLAEAAIASVARAAVGRDGISYLIAVTRFGVETALTPLYVASVLAQAGAVDLSEALQLLQACARREPPSADRPKEGRRTN